MYDDHNVRDFHQPFISAWLADMQALDHHRREMGLALLPFTVPYFIPEKVDCRDFEGD